MNYFKTTTTVLMMLATVLTAQAQMSLNWSQNYQHTASPGYSNESRKIAVDSNGNTYVLMDATTEIDPLGVVSATPQHYTVLLKYDVNGNFVASRQAYVVNHLVSGFDNLGAFGLEIDANNNIYIGFNSFDPNTNFNVVMTKYNSNLVRLWTYTFNPAGIDLGLDMKVTPNGAVYSLIKSMSGGTQYKIIAADTTAITGTNVHYSFLNTTEVVKSIVVNGLDEVFATGSQLSGGFTSIMTASISPAGNLKWKRIFNGGSANRNDIGNQIVKGPNQELYVVGTSDRGTPFGNDPIVLKYFGGNGRLAWNTYLDADSLDNMGISISTDNPSFVFVGSVSGNEVLVDRLETGRGLHTGRFVYEPIPANNYNVIDSVSVTKVLVSPNNNTYITGNIYAKDTGNENFNAYYLARVIPKTGRGPIGSALELNDELSPEGTFNKSYNSADIALNYSSGKIHTLFNSFSTFDTHDAETVHISSYDLPVLFRTGSLMNSATDNIQVYPNPASSFINISDESGVVNSVEILDLTGKTYLIQQNQKLSSGDQGIPGVISESFNRTISLEGLSSGTYFIKIIKSDGEIITRKFMKQ